jgi:hyperosmotically inducible periplasmic protein
MNKYIVAIALAAVPALVVGTYAPAQTTSSETTSLMKSSDVVAPDNTKSNSKDPSNRAATSDEQKNDATGIDLAKRSRRSVMSDKSLSTYGHNVKIVSVDGTVTLNGVVRSADEKAQIEEKAASIAGEGHVINALKWHRRSSRNHTV